MSEERSEKERARELLLIAAEGSITRDGRDENGYGSTERERGVRRPGTLGRPKEARNMNVTHVQ